MSPNHNRNVWRKIKFGDAVRNVNENIKNPDTESVERVIGLEHLDPGELKIDRWGEFNEQTTFTRRVRPGQTLFGKRRAYQRKTAYSEFDAVCSGDILVFESADPEVLLPALLPFIAMTEQFYARALETSAGSLSPRTRWSDLATFEFYLPPLIDQKKIADLLWQLESHRRDLGNEITQFGNFLSSYRRDAIEKLSATNGLVSLGDLVKFAGGSAFPERYQGQSLGIPFLKVSDLGDDTYVTESANYVERKLLETELKARTWPPGTVVFPKVGAALLSERRRILATESALDNNLMGLVPSDSLIPEFLHLFMETISLGSIAQVGVIPSVNQSHLSKLQIPLPTLDEQETLIHHYRSLLDAQAKTMNEANQLLELRAAILAGLGAGAL